MTCEQVVVKISKERERREEMEEKSLVLNNKYNSFHPYSEYAYIGKRTNEETNKQAMRQSDS